MGKSLSVGIADLKATGNPLDSPGRREASFGHPERLSRRPTPTPARLDNEVTNSLVMVVLPRRHWPADRTPLSSKVSHRGMSKRRASCQVLYLNSQLRATPRWCGHRPSRRSARSTSVGAPPLASSVSMAGVHSGGGEGTLVLKCWIRTSVSSRGADSRVRALMSQNDPKRTLFALTAEAEAKRPAGCPLHSLGAFCTQENSASASGGRPFFVGGGSRVTGTLPRIC